MTISSGPENGQQQNLKFQDYETYNPTDQSMNMSVSQSKVSQVSKSQYTTDF